jgi:predicted transcriptional regulator of viral defense system
MASENSIVSAKTLSELVDQLQASGRYTFVRDEALRALHSNALSIKKAVMRLSVKGRIAVPRRGFYVIVPLEYRIAGAPPPPWFIDQLMSHLDRPYYVSILSAAVLHGAAHQQPQEYQVMTDEPQRQIKVGRARIRFLVKRNIRGVSTEERKTETGTVRVSTPEVTAIDLFRYPSAAGGLDNAATVLGELAEHLDKQKLVDAARAEGELACLQRLGYVLGNVGAGNRTSALCKWINEREPRNTPLNPRRSIKGCPVDRRWRIIVNDTIERNI